MKKMTKCLLIILTFFALVSCAGAGYQGEGGAYREPGRAIRCDQEGHCTRN